MANPSSPAQDAFLISVGRFVVLWATLEFGVDVVIVILHKLFGGRKVEAERPRSLNRKITYLKRIATRGGLPPELAERLLSLVGAIKAEAGNRHDLVHGMALRAVPGTSAMRMTRLTWDENRFGKVFTIDAAGTQQLANRIESLADQVMSLGEALMASLPRT